MKLSAYHISDEYIEVKVRGDSLSTGTMSSNEAADFAHSLLDVAEEIYDKYGMDIRDFINGCE